MNCAKSIGEWRVSLHLREEVRTGEEEPTSGRRSSGRRRRRPEEEEEGEERTDDGRSVHVPTTTERADVRHRRLRLSLQTNFCNSSEIGRQSS